MVSVRPKYGGYLDEFYCLSTDVKPTDDSIENGSTLIELDTETKYMYDGENRRWIEWTGVDLIPDFWNNFGKSGGSRSSAVNTGRSTASDDIYTVNLELFFNPATNIISTTSFDGTYADISSRISNGEPVLMHYKINYPTGEVANVEDVATYVEGDSFLSVMFIQNGNFYFLGANVILFAAPSYAWAVGGIACLSALIAPDDSVYADMFYFPLGGVSGGSGESDDQPVVPPDYDPGVPQIID